MLKNLKIGSSLSLWRYWTYKASVAYGLRYKRSKLGVAWPALSLLLVTIVIGLVWGTLLQKESILTYCLYVLSGYAVWTLLSGSIEQGCREINTLQTGGLPLFTLILERFFTLVLNFAYLVPLLLIFTVIAHEGSYLHLIYLPLVVVFLSTWTLGVIALLIAINSVVPDIRFLILSIMRVAFLATPIIWEASRLGIYEKYIWINPFYIPLESLRFAISGIGTSIETVWLLIPYSVSLFVLGMFFLNNSLKKLGE